MWMERFLESLNLNKILLLFLIYSFLYDFEGQ